MYDILITIITFCIFLLLMIYAIKESLRRKRQKKDDQWIEANFDLKGCYVFMSIGILFFIGVTVAHYFRLFIYDSLFVYIELCIVSLVFAGIAFVLSWHKVIIKQDTGTIIVYKFLRKRTFFVKDITLIKHKITSWSAYIGNKKLFYMSAKYFVYPMSFYNFIIKESNCKKIFPKGYEM